MYVAWWDVHRISYLCWETQKNHLDPTCPVSGDVRGIPHMGRMGHLSALGSLVLKQFNNGNINNSY